jgi:hypothetical protein
MRSSSASLASAGEPGMTPEKKTGQFLCPPKSDPEAFSGRVSRFAVIPKTFEGTAHQSQVLTKRAWASRRHADTCRAGKK